MPPFARVAAAYEDIVEDAGFALGTTPFGLDWERGRWPAPWHDAFFVALHGSFYSTPVWRGAGIVFAATDRSRHVPTGAWQSVVAGFGPTGGELRRPADVAFAPDGRLFFADDVGGAIYYVAPVSLRAR